MKTGPLGTTGITISTLGMGTGTADASGRCRQAALAEKRLIYLLRHAFDRGIRHWDTAGMYGTQSTVGKALGEAGRDKVVITTKIPYAGAEDALQTFHDALRDLDTDYVDICLLHGVRTRRDLLSRRPALDTLLRLRDQGKIRAVGLSAHGLDVLDTAAAWSGIEVVWGRINMAGLCMDTRKQSLYDSLVAVSWLKRLVKLLPPGIIAPVRPSATVRPVSHAERNETRRLLTRLHEQGKGVIGMKVFAEGRLCTEAARAMAFARAAGFLDGIIAGMLTEEEIDENCRMWTSTV